MNRQKNTNSFNSHNKAPSHSKSLIKFSTASTCSDVRPAVHGTIVANTVNKKWHNGTWKMPQFRCEHGNCSVFSPTSSSLAQAKWMDAEIAHRRIAGNVKKVTSSLLTVSVDSSTSINVRINHRDRTAPAINGHKALFNPQSLRNYDTNSSWPFRCVDTNNNSNNDAQKKVLLIFNLRKINFSCGRGQEEQNTRQLRHCFHRSLSLPIWMLCHRACRNAKQMSTNKLSTHEK